MKKKHALLISSVLIAGSIVFSGVYIGNSIKEAAKPKIVKQDKVLLTEQEAAEFLNFSLEDFQTILHTEKEMLNMSWGEDYNFRYIPYVEVGIHKYFTKVGLVRWIESNADNRKRLDKLN